MRSDCSNTTGNRSKTGVHGLRFRLRNFWLFARNAADLGWAFHKTINLRQPLLWVICFSLAERIVAMILETK
jgi:hypothetical protein